MMADLMHLLAVPESLVRAMRADHTALLRPSEHVGVSSLLGSWVEPRPLVDLLAVAIFQGEPLLDDSGASFNKPTVHTPERVRELYPQISKAFRTAHGPQVESDDWEWYHDEIGRVIHVFGCASRHGECVVSVRRRPSDLEESKHIRMPFDYSHEPYSRPLRKSGKPSADTSMLWPMIGSFAGGVVVGMFAVCYWRHKRFAKCHNNDHSSTSEHSEPIG